MSRPSPLATGEAYGPPLSLLPHDLPAECSVKEPGVIAGCRGVMSVRNNAPVDRYRWDDTGNAVRCIHCGTDVTAATTANVWREMLAPAPLFTVSPANLDARERCEAIPNATNDGRSVYLPCDRAARYAREHKASIGDVVTRARESDAVLCRFCFADVTALVSAESWALVLAPAVPALPSPNARGNELRSIVADGLDGVRVTLAEGRPLKAQEYADELAWDALDAIAAGCDDPAGLARDLVSLRAEVSAAQR